MTPTDRYAGRDARFMELDRLIALEDASARQNPPSAPKIRKHVITPRVLAKRKEQSDKWALLRSRRDTCQHEKWKIHGTVQIICDNCGTTRRQWKDTPQGPMPL